MKKIYQTVIDKGKGNCMQAAIASLLDLELDRVPNFIEYKSGWFKCLYEFLYSNEYEYDTILYNKNFNRLISPTIACFKKERWYNKSILSLNNLKKEEGINGYFYASVLSPKYFNYTDGFLNTHAVIIDSNCKIIHDPNPEYQNILKYPLANLLKFNGIIDVTIIRKKIKT